MLVALGILVLPEAAVTLLLVLPYSGNNTERVSLYFILYILMSIRGNMISISAKVYGIFTLFRGQSVVLSGAIAWV